MLGKSLSRFDAISRRRCAWHDTDGCAVLMVGSDGPRDVAGRELVAG